MAVLLSTLHRRSAATVMTALLAALTLAGCGANSSSSSSSAGSYSVTVSGSHLTIYLSEPANPDQQQRDIVDAEQLAFSQQSSAISDFHLSEHVLQNSLLSNSARYAIQDKTAIAYLGELVPGTSEQTVGITNALDLLQLSPTDTALELTQSTDAISGAPQKYFEDWSYYGRTFARMVPSSAQEADFIATQLQAMKLTSLYIQQGGGDYGKALAHALRSAAGHGGISVTSSESSADAIFYAGNSAAGAASFFNAAASTAPTAKLFGPSALDAQSFLSALSSTAAKRCYISTPGIAQRSLDAQGQAFETSFKQTYGHAPATQAIFGYAAMSAVLTSIKQEGTDADNRALVAKELLRLKNQPSVIGSFSFSSDGAISVDDFLLNRVQGDQLTPLAAAQA